MSKILSTLKNYAVSVARDMVAPSTWQTVGMLLMYCMIPSAVLSPFVIGWCIRNPPGSTSSAQIDAVFSAFMAVAGALAVTVLAAGWVLATAALFIEFKGKGRK